MNLTLDVRSREESDSTVVLLAGDLDRANAWALTAAIIRCEKVHPARVVVDLERLAFIDCGGLRALRDAARRSRRSGFDFALANPSAPVARLLHMTGVDKSLEVLAGR
jgi:anti-sigma B factor antagonist